MLCSCQWETRGDTKQMPATPGVLFPNITKERGKALLSIKALGPNFKGLLNWLAVTIAALIPLGCAGGFFLLLVFHVHQCFISLSAPKINSGGAETLCPV